MTLTYCLLAPPVYKASAEIIIDPRDIQVVANDLNPSAIAPDGGIAQVESQTRVVQSSSVLLRAIAATHLTDDTEFNGKGTLDKVFALLGAGPAQDSVEATVLRELSRHVTVKRADKVFVIEVSVAANSAVKAAALTNAVADAYLVDLADARTQAGERASAALTARLESLRARVENAENAIQNYKEANDIVTPGGQLIGDQKIIDLSSQLTAAQSRTAALLVKLDQINAARRTSGTPASTAETLQSAVISNLREQESSILRRQGELSAELGPDHPMMASIRAQLLNVQNLIIAELDRINEATQADYQRALGDQRQIAARLQQVTNSAAVVGHASVQLRELERRLEADRSVYAQFLVRAQEISEQSGIDTTNARVITRAVAPAKKSWPPGLLLLAGAIGTGLALGGAWALLREYMRPSILGRQQIERVVGAPVIAILRGADVARFKKPKNGAGKSRALAVVSLALRRLFDVNAGESEMGAMRSLLLTSGASDLKVRRDVCALFELAARRRGERVVLIDADAARCDQGTAIRVVDVLRGHLPHEELHQDALVRVTNQAPDLDERFDLLIIDGGVLSENLSIEPLLGAVDQVIMVGQIALTSQVDVASTADAAAIMGRPISAVILIDPMAA